MAYVITQSCCNDASCVAVCPVGCIHPRPDEPDYRTAAMLYIDPEVCIDCGACAISCPIDAVYLEDDLPDQLMPYAGINLQHYAEGRTSTPGPVLLESPTFPARDRPSLRVAIIGSGPAGCYAATELLSHRDVRVEVDMYDRLLTPWGLVRAGVAPDHAKTKTVADAFARMTEHEDFRFRLGVEIGSHLSHDELLSHYHSVIYTVGASADRRLGVPGEDLAGSHSAADFVAWYNGHPDHAHRRFDFSGERAVIFGNGNVALDIARVLMTDPEDLAFTDIADHALEQLRKSSIREVVVVGRRGPAQAAYTGPELLALDGLAGVGVTVDPTGLSPENHVSLGTAAPLKESLAAGYGSRPAPEGRRIVLRYFGSPAEIIGLESVTGVRIAQTELVIAADSAMRAQPTGETEVIATGLVLRAIGFRGTAVHGLPFDEDRGVLPNVAGRVVIPDDGTPIPGVYAAGWIKRGPSGVIGTNKKCAEETVDALLADYARGAHGEPACDRRWLEDLLKLRQPEAVDTRGWKAIDAHERGRGAADGRPRVKTTSTAALAVLAAMPGTAPS